MRRTSGIGDAPILYIHTSVHTVLCFSWPTLNMKLELMGACWSFIRSVNRPSLRASQWTVDIDRLSVCDQLPGLQLTSTGHRQVSAEAS